MHQQSSLRAVALALAVASTAACSGPESRADTSAAARTDSASGASAAAGVAAADSASGAVAANAPRPADALPQNLKGRIPVVEYHLIGDTESRYGRTRENFRKDMQLLYDRGYRPITISQMLDKDFKDVPAGMSPVAFVFDDASPGQFLYRENNGQLEIDPRSGVGIWMDFAKEHPDWKGRATFCMLSGAAEGRSFFGDKPQFAGQKKEWRFQKVKWLADNGFELCNHTLWHARLDKYGDAMVQEQIARLNLAIDSAVPGYKVRTFALPLGMWPKNRAVAAKGSWTDPKSGKTTSYDFDAILEVAGGPTRSPYDAQFNPKSINRIEVFGDELRKILDRLDQNKTRFVK